MKTIQQAASEAAKNYKQDVIGILAYKEGAEAGFKDGYISRQEEFLSRVEEAFKLGAESREHEVRGLHARVKELKMGLADFKKEHESIVEYYEDELRKTKQQRP